jgi:peptidoglycan/xylan/chitin deacetylase (PgdA/CDA1 family)
MKKLVKGMLLGSGAVGALGYLRSPGVVILRYHSVLENPNDLDAVIGCGIVHSAAVFERQMRFLSQSLAPVTMDDVFEYARGVRKPPRRAVAVTFDDGFSDNAEIAAPLMERFRIPGAFYVTTGSIEPNPPPWFIRVRRAFCLSTSKDFTSPVSGTRFNLDAPLEKRQAFLQACEQCAVLALAEQLPLLDQMELLLDVGNYRDARGLMMTEEQIRCLDAAGHIVGSHTVAHSNMAHIPSDSLRVELQQSKDTLERLLGKEVRHFSYPSPILQPHYDERTVQLSREIGYRTAVTCSHGLCRPEHEPLACRRIAVPGNFADFRWSLETVFAGLS